MKNILVFTSTFPRFTSGDATPPFVYNLSKWLSEKWLNITIITPRVPWAKNFESRDWMEIYRYWYFFSEKLEKLCDWGIISNLKNNKLLYFQVPFLFIAGFLFMIKIVTKKNIEIIHAHWLIPQWLLAVIYKKFINNNIKIIVTSHWSDISSLQMLLFKYLKIYTLQNIDILTVVSTDLKNKINNYWEFSNLKIIIAPMGVDEIKFNSSNYDKKIRLSHSIDWPLILFVWRLVEGKWVSYLIKWMLKIINKYPKAKLLIVWWWPLKTNLEILTRELKLENNVTFLWPIENNNLPAYYASADLFIWPSHKTNDGAEEWFWLVFVEAILSGCITIWTSLPWIMDIISNWKTGLLIKEKDPDDIAMNAIKALSWNHIDKNLAIKVTKDKFSWSKVTNTYYNLFTNL